MPIYLDGPVIRRDPVLEEFDTPFKAYVKARFEDQWMNNLTPLLGMVYEQAGFQVEDITGAALRVDAATARARVKEAGVQLEVPETGMSADALEALIARQQRRRLLEDSINRSPMGWRSISGIGALLAAGVLDPLNVAAAFFPVVGPARYSLMLGQAGSALGRAGVRAGVGVVEGTVGMAALEPAYYSSHQALQDDYSGLDSLTNIALGGALGGGLHVTGGAVGDLLGRAVREAKPPALQYKPAASLTPEERLIEMRMGERLSDLKEAEAAYARIPDSFGGKVISTDVVRELSPDYLADRTQSIAVHEPSSAFSKHLYTKRLAEAPKAGEDPMVLITAGGTGAGKTTALEGLLAPELKRAQVIYDTNLNRFPSAKAKIDEALAAGKRVIIAYVYRDPEDALVNGMLARAMRQEGKPGSGRAVLLEDHLDTHVGAARVVRELAEAYRADGRVQFRGVDNTLGAGKAREVPLEELPELHYTEDLYDKLAKQVDAERAAGRISEALYRAVSGPRGLAARLAREAQGPSGPPRPSPGEEPQPAGTGGARAPLSAGLTAAQAVSAVSHPTREAALRAAVAQSVDGNVPDVEALIRADPASGLTPVASPLDDLFDTARRQLAPEAMRVAEPAASTAAIARLEAAPKTTELRDAETELQTLVDGLKQRFAARKAPPEALKKQLAEVAAATKEWDQLADAARAAAVCDLGRGG